MTDLTRLSAAALSDLLSAGDVSSVEAVRAHLDRIEAVDADVHAFLHVAGEKAVRTATEIDERRAAGDALGRPDRDQGRPRHPGHALDLRVEDPRGLDPALRRDRGAQAPRGRPGAARQDQYGRVRHGLLDRALGLRAH